MFRRKFQEFMRLKSDLNKLKMKKLIKFLIKAKSTLNRLKNV